MYKVITFIFLYPLEEAEEVSSTKKQKSKLKKKMIKTTKAFCRWYIYTESLDSLKKTSIRRKRCVART